MEPNQIFVFGSNSSGFHGAGAAGYASFGEMGNVWRKYEYNQYQNGTKWKWNVKGKAVGFQEGKEGKSYALPTVTKAGKKCSITLQEIRHKIYDLYEFADLQPDYEFLIAYNANSTNLNGYSSMDLAKAFCTNKHNVLREIPFNNIFEENFHELVFDEYEHLKNLNDIKEL